MTYLPEAAVNQTQEKEVIRVLAKAGKEALAKAFARSRGYGVKEVRAQGAKTKQLVNDIQGLMKQYGITPRDFYVADNLSRMEFKGVFGKTAKAKDVKRFGGLAGKPVTIYVTVSPGRTVWVQIKAFKGEASLSLALQKRDLASTFVVVQRAVKQLFASILA
jgi:hypothetical protein